MGKQGPCCHCGVTSTPLWRNGPPEKPVLCNACGSRWRTKGNLVNYTPLHARPEHENPEEIRFLKSKGSPLKNKESKIYKRKFDSKASAQFADEDFNYELKIKGYDEDLSNRSSSGSAISNPESYAQFADASVFTDPSQNAVWDSTVPSRKRTCVARQQRTPSSVEKLTKDLYNIWQEHQSSFLSEFSEEGLLFETEKPMVSVEIGHGSVLIKHPNSVAEEEEESEASSLTFASKLETLHSRTFKDIDSFIEGIQHVKNPNDLGDKDPLGTLKLLTDHSSPLRNINLEGIVNFDNFAGRLAIEEQQLLLQFLPEEDIRDNKDNLDRDSISMSSLKSMFESPQFKVDLLWLQRLLEDGVFDEVETEDVRVLKKLIICDFTKWNWVEPYKLFKDSRTLNSTEGSKHSGQKEVLSSQRGIIRSVPYDRVTTTDDAFLTAINGTNSLCESSDDDLLLDIPSNGSFPQAELLLPT